MKLTVRHYATILDRALAEASSEHEKEKVMKDFAQMIEKDGKTSRLNEILIFWQALYNKRHGLIDVTIETADKDSVKFPNSFAGKRVAQKTIMNPSLIGGNIIRIGDYIVDGSIRSKINLIRN